jgi:hypothetical protein
VEFDADRYILVAVTVYRLILRHITEHLNLQGTTGSSRGVGGGRRLVPRVNRANAKVVIRTCFQTRVQYEFRLKSSGLLHCRGSHVDSNVLHHFSCTRRVSLRTFGRVNCR